MNERRPEDCNVCKKFKVLEGKKITNIKIIKPNLSKQPDNKFRWAGRAVEITTGDGNKYQLYPDQGPCVWSYLCKITEDFEVVYGVKIIKTHKFVHKATAGGKRWTNTSFFLRVKGGDMIQFSFYSEAVDRFPSAAEFEPIEKINRYPLIEPIKAEMPPLRIEP